jgi:hypothetical protein
VAVSAPRRAGRLARRAGRAVGRRLKRGGVALARGAWEERTAIAAIGGAGIIGYLEGNDSLKFIPDIGIGRIPTLAVGTYVVGRIMNSQKLRHAGLGLAAAAVFGVALRAGQESAGKTKK